MSYSTYLVGHSFDASVTLDHLVNGLRRFQEGVATVNYSDLGGMDLIEQHTSSPGSAMGTLSIPCSSRSPGTSSIDAALSSIDKSKISASSIAVSGGGGACGISIYPFGIFPPGAFLKAISRIFCHASYLFTACCCSLYMAPS